MWHYLVLLLGAVVCSQNSNNSPLSGTITSPNYPKLYPNFNESTWDINVPEGYHVSLNFSVFDIEPSENCSCGFVKVMADGKELGHFCGPMNSSAHPGNRQFVSQGNQMTIHFQSNFSEEMDGGIIPYKGFQAFYQAIVVICEDPPVLTNGQYKFLTAPGNLEYKSVIQYQCNSPYYYMVTPNGSDTFSCSAQRDWRDEHGGDKIPRCRPVCGKPENPVTSFGRILHGKKAEPGNFPWQVYVSRYGTAGGALIGEQWVLTAAQVLPDNVEKQDLNDVLVYMGSLNMKNLMEMDTYPVEAFYMHPNFNRNNYDNDIALIRLKNPVVMNQNVSPICLPSPEDEDDIYQKDRVGYVSGYGKTENHKVANELHYVSVPVASRQACKTYLNKKRPAIRYPSDEDKYLFSRNMFCAGFPEGSLNKGDSCSGDSGGAYTSQNRQDTWVATGLVSWGFSCGQGYGFYTKVSNYVDWIKSYVGEDA
ncbi:complement C1r L homeolog precursor [Xenopus laevis]|uniref:Complement C1r L homeolog precursor n=1 Tax=Xenopus laevis TaxID=8355 RepID=Q6GLK4_XENLA|nr:complement C1r L homeolog precursor [Xenopus laevis]AAH74475.1 MGC84776 protein [Xenopus laevis]